LRATSALISQGASRNELGFRPADQRPGNQFFGPRYVATLFGMVMLSHQIGGFLGAYLGGKAFEATGSYDWMWWADIALCLFAAAIHLPIREAKPALAAAAAA
jgi:hypothetical protein